MYEAYFKRILDLVIASLALLFFLPIILILFVSVKLDSMGPFLFVQPRVGRNLMLFNIYKIRTMDIKSSKNALNPSLTYITTKGPDDPRITKIGRFLRRTHLDEIPQLFNVIKGDMSLIGVRPDAPTQIKDYSIHFWTTRHYKRPGITGLAQIYSSKENFSFSDRCRFDAFYSKKRIPISLDIYIMYKTIQKVWKFSSF